MRLVFSFVVASIVLLSSTQILVDSFVEWGSNSHTFLPIFTTTTTSSSSSHSRRDIRRVTTKTTFFTSSNAMKSTEEDQSDAPLPKFPNRIPMERLGTRHESLEAFHNAVGKSSGPAKKTKEYTLIVVTETLQEWPRKQRILLGLKNRGFGKGKYNSFGGKFLHDETISDGTRETVEECACRELKEETNLHISLETMKESKVGIQRFTFADNDKEMLVHLFFLDLAHTHQSESARNEPAYEIKACEEITPQWFEDFDDVPFDNMFADDSLWLTALLTKAASDHSPLPIRPSKGQPPLKINGSYYFSKDCEETNTILHYHMDVAIPQFDL